MTDSKGKKLAMLTANTALAMAFIGNSTLIPVKNPTTEPEGAPDMERKRYELDPNTAPSEQLKEAKAHSGKRRKITYLPHIGAKQIAKAKARAAKAAAKNKDLT